MEKIKKNSIYLIIILGVLSLSFYYPESKLLSNIVEKLEIYNAQFPFQKVYVDCDKSSYITNETLNFSAFVLEETNNKLSNTGILYLELLGTNNQSIIQQKLEYRNGVVNGAINLPDTLSSGEYYLVAYTNWMKNFDRDLIFKSKIKIYSPNNIDTFKRTLLFNDLNLEFYPEGGALVDELTSKISVTAVNKFGEGIELEGDIYDNNDTKISSFVTNSIGIGAFILNPKKNKTYYAKTIHEGSIKIVPLPNTRPSGLVVQVQNSNTENIKIITQSKDFDPGKLLFVVQSQNNIYYSATSKNKNGNSIVSIPKKDLPEGIAQIVVFDEAGNVIVERLIFVNHPEKDSFGFDVDRSTFSTHEKIDINFSGGQTSVFSISVNNSGQASENIFSYLFLSSNVGSIGNIPNYILQEDSPEAKSIMDNLLITKKWKRFKWQEVLKNEIPKPNYYLEKGLKIKGTLIDDIGNDTLKNFEVLLSIPKELVTYEVKSDDNGYINANIYNFYENRQLFIQLKDAFELQSNIKLLIDNDFIKFDKIKVAKTDIIDNKLKERIRILSENQRIELAFDPVAINKRSGLNEKSLIKGIVSDNFKKLYDNEIFLADYIDFPSMRDIFREIVPGVTIPLNKNDLRMYSKENVGNFINRPVFFIDGVLTNNLDYILKINPANIESIGIISSFENREQIGYTAVNGVLCINLKSDRKLTDMQSDANIITLMGLSNLSEMIIPNFDINIDSRIPDFRSVLYWNPEIRISQQIEESIDFYTSYEKGEYQIIVNGISKDEGPFYMTKTIVVD